MVVLAVQDLPVRREHGEMLLHYIQDAEQTCRVDCGFVFEFPRVTNDGWRRWMR